MEFYTLRLQIGTYLPGVLNYAVMDQDDPLVAAEVRVGIVFGDPSVGSPPCVAYPEIAVEIFCRDLLCQMLDPSGRTELMYRAFFYYCYSRGVITPVFVLSEPFQDNLCSVSLSNIAHDAAHANIILSH